MKKLSQILATGIQSMFVNYGISFYTYFSIILSEIFYAWKFLPDSALLFTILLILNCIAVCICGICKRIWICTKYEFIITRVYWSVLLTLCIIACIFDIFWGFMFFFIPIAVSFVAIIIRNFQTKSFEESSSFALLLLSWIFKNPIVWVISVGVLGLFPMGVFFYSLLVTLESKMLVALIVIIYFVCVPFIAYFEDQSLCSNIFEIGYEIVWTKALDEMIKKYDVSDDVFYTEEFIYVAYKFKVIKANEPEKAEKQFLEDIQKIQGLLENNKK